ncbi:E3 ubiquitin-protein ligase DZIP3-like [Impatiens glandulifera]|uniref:E3 ubiquitin-protein ligase DZIP3-like n=1 Tax=Impatiens glandulifera TaxID=253017 RepID=UPI001FB05B03|nr:E3 ubiquitin-protein ligase DZIP3-like [Impatiens glandulifera]
MDIDKDPYCKAWPLHFSVIEDDNVEVPADDKLYFYILVVASFTTIYISDVGSEVVQTRENSDSFIIPRENLLSDGKQVLWAIVSGMVDDVGVQPNESMMESIHKVAQNLAIEPDNQNKKILPFFVTIYVEKSVDSKSYDEEEGEEDDDEEEEFDEEEEEFDEEDLIDFMEEGEVRLPETSLEEEMRWWPKMEICSAAELDGGENCVICQDELSSMDERELKRMGCCRHVFHGECIYKWLNLNNVCPLCRFQVI